jgi:hypothetical protein
MSRIQIEVVPSNPYDSCLTNYVDFIPGAS